MARTAAEPRRRIPSVDALLRSSPGRRAAATFGRSLIKRTLTRALDEVRAAAARGVEPPTEDEILARAIGVAASAAHGLTRVINATGGVRHTGLGRAPLPRAAAKAAVLAATGYSDLEVERETGRRGRRANGWSCLSRR
jgi:L-seryl-tRNA(Ser) seleniumtransferase